jgi:hypothetical protein
MEAVKEQEKVKGRTYSPVNGRITSFYTKEGELRECPEGFMTEDECFAMVTENITRYYEEHGLL